PPEKQQKLATFLDEAFALIDDLIDNAQRRLTLIQQLKTSFLYRAFEEVDKTGWETRPLGEVCDYARSSTNDNILPYLGMEQIESGTGKITGSLIPVKTKSAAFLFNQSHVLFGRLRPYLRKVWLPNQAGRCSMEIFPIKPKSCLERRFLFYWLLRDEVINKINGTCTGTRMPRANMNKVLHFHISYPPLPEQQKIANFLDNAFNNVALLADNATTRLNTVKHLKTALLAKVFHETPLTAPPHSTPDKKSIPKDHIPKETTA
ncbi:MAG: restriction endonuclease subunit S, partial [Acetobacter sp.]|nr:restriction endonuclease subunit S [Acetobacter sp.]